MTPETAPSLPVSAKSFLRAAVLALAVTAPAYSDTPAPVALTGYELKALCTIDASTMEICGGYVAGYSDELQTRSQAVGRTINADAAALMAPCPGKQLAELIVSTVKELNAHPLSDPALTAVGLALHPLLGCDGSLPSSSNPHYITLFADGDRLKGFCIGSDHNDRLECEGYIRAVADATLLLLNHATVQAFKSCTPTWQTPDQAVSATIVYLNGHPEHGKAPAPTLIQAALLPPTCPLAPVATPPASP